MVGLLDDPKALGLLTTGLALLGSRGRFGEALGQAGMQGLGAMQQAQQRGQQKQVQDFQLRQLKREEEAAKKKQADEQAMIEAARASMMPGFPGLSGNNLVNEALPPDLQIGAMAPVPARPAGFDQRAFIDRMRMINPLEAMRLEQSLKKDTPFNKVDPKDYTTESVAKFAQTGNYGDLIPARKMEVAEGQVYDPYNVKPGTRMSRPQLVDTGAGFMFVTPESGMQIPKSMSPAERDAAARGWASNRIAQQRLALDQGVAVADMGGPNQIALTRQFGKADKGYRWKPDGTQERIPGGPADEKSGLDAEKRAQRTRLAVDRADFVLGQLDQLGKNAGFFETGLTGAALGVVPGTDAYDVRRLADSIKANIGFGELQAMREASPTGGALGQVAVQELNFLQSALGSLDANQSRAQLNNSIAKVKQHYSNWKNIMQQAQAPNTGGASGGWSAQPASVQSEDGWSAQPRR